MMRFSSSMLQGCGLSNFWQIWRPQLTTRPATTTTVLLLVLVLVVAAFTSFLWIDTFKFSINNSITNNTNTTQHHHIPSSCTINNQTITCPINYPKPFQTQDHDPSSNPICPNYFRWIHEDLKPWKATGITRNMLERAKKTANFRLIIIKGTAYIETFSRAFQTRDVFTIWGILQLLKRYPGRLPDLELMFDCNDFPVIQSSQYRVPLSKTPPPLFAYCGDKWTLDIVFPDWSFWGWIEVNIKPWEIILKEIKEGNNITKWIERKPYAYWKGNPYTGEFRRELLKCNASDAHDWNARVYAQDWIVESQNGFKQSDLSRQCTHRYKIYIEGQAWSVSEKYIIACDSLTLLVNPRYYDFFSRSLQPLQHYWPISKSMCKSIKYAVDWGNNQKQKAQEMGKAASNFTQEELKMDYVYDYMFHLLNEYAKLLKFEPTIPKGAIDLCSEIMTCQAWGLEKEFMMETLVKGPSIESPCTLPPPYKPQDLAGFNKAKSDTIKQVEVWEKRYWESINKHW